MCTCGDKKYQTTVANVATQQTHFQIFVFYVCQPPSLCNLVYVIMTIEIVQIHAQMQRYLNLRSYSDPIFATNDKECTLYDYLCILAWYIYWLGQLLLENALLKYELLQYI